MAFTITAGQGITVETLGSKYSVKTKGTKTSLLIIDYTNGDETSADFSFSENYPSLSDLEVLTCERNTSDVMEQLVLSLTATGVYRIPIDVHMSVDKFFVTISNTGGTPDGSMTIYGIDDSKA